MQQLRLIALIGVSVVALGLAGCSDGGPNDPSVNKINGPVTTAKPEGTAVKPSPRRQMMNPGLASSPSGGGSDSL